MANPNDNLRRLYQNGLKHFSLPDFDTFQQDMRDEEKRKRFYNNMQGAYSLPDFDTFSQDIGAVTPPPAQPQAQAQPQQTTSTVKPVTDNTAQQASVQPTVQTSSQPAQPEGWKPTPMQQRAFQMQMDEANARLKKQGEEFKQRMEGIEKGNRPGAFMGEREFNPQTGKMETHYYTTQGERVGTRMEQSHANTEYHNWWENNTEAGKRSKEQRLQREFDEKLSYLWQRHNPAEGENAAEQAWSAAESAYNAKAERNREAANFNVQNFAMNSTDAVAFKQMETVDNFTDRLTTHDMDVLMDNAWNNLGEEGQKSLIDDCYQMLRRRNPGVDDLVLYGKAKEFARQQSDLRMYHLAVEKNLPKSNLEYFMRKVGDMNLVTNIGKGIAVNRVKKTGDMAAYEAANEQYRQDGHKILDVAGTVTGFALDPTTWMSAGVGGMATRGAMWAGGRVLAGRGATAAVTNAATRQFATSMTGRVIGGIAGGAANFGTFEGIKEMETQFAHGGHIVGQDDTGRYLNEGYSASAVAGQAAHGFLMGGAIGWLTPVSGNVADKLVRSTSSTGLKVMERAGVYSGATMLEGTIFSVPEWIEGNRDAMDVWTDNMAMMVGFKAKHMIKSAGNVLGDLKASFDSPTNGRKNRLDFESRLRQRMDAPSDGGLSLTKDEAAELSKHGYGDLRELVESAERTGDATKGELITANAPEIVSRLTDMVTDPRISEAARAKMYYYATGRKLPESTVMKGELIEDGEGGFIVESQGANGVITSRSFKSRKAADLELERIKRQTELNHIEIGERYQQTADFENRLQEACRTVAAENGWDMVEVYRTCEEARRNNLRGGDKQFDEAQQNILRKVTEAMGEFEETSVTDNMRGRINDKYGVDIDNAIRKEANRRTIAEQTAIDEYLDELIPKNAKERNTVEDAEAEDITNQKLLTDEPEATTPTNDAPIDPRFDNPTTPEYDPHQPGGEQKPVGRAVMKYQDRPVEVLSGRVVMMEDGTMIDNERSDASIVVRDLETGKVEMVSPDAILSYEGYPAEVEVPQDNVAPEAETPAEPQPKYTTGQIKIRNSDGTETRGVLTGFVDENGNHEYYVEGDLQQLHYASEHELDNILSEYTPDEPQEVKQPQPAEPQPVDPNRPTQEGVANVEDYDKGYSFGIDETQGISDSELTAKISELRTDAERLTDFGRGMLEAYEYEQQRRAMEQQLVPVDAETVPKTEETTLNPMETGVNITETVPKTEIPIENVQQSVDDGNVVVPAPAGSVRKGIDADGKEWSTTMANTYGYIKGTEGVDGDHIDVFLHENMDMWNGRKVYVVDQTNTDGSFDEHKVMLSFNNKDEAMSAYLANYDATWGQTHPGLRISETNIEDFNKWVQSSHRKTKPFADYSTVSKITDEAPVEQPTQPAAAITGEGYKVEPKPYTNKQGKTLDTYLVTFDRDFSKEELSTLRAKAKALKGWYDRETRGWMLRSADDAKAFAKDIVGKSEDEVADEAPLSLADMEKPASDKPKKAPVNRVNVEGVMADLSTKGETKLSDHAEPVEPTQTKPKKRRWISDEDADEFNNLRDNLRNHFGKGDDIVQESAEGYGKPQPKQMDAEVLRMGTRMTYLMMKGGLRSFADYCEAMIDELPDIFDDMRPHLKSLYAAAQNMEEVIELGWDEEMDDRKTVKAFDVYNFDKPRAKDIIATSQHIVDEQSSQQHTDQIIQTLKDQRNEQRKKEADETSADTEAIADKAEAVASKVESELEVATTEQDAERLSRDLDKEIEDVNKQLALLGYYEAVEDDSKFHESYGYMLTAEKKAVSDATNLAKQIVKDLGIDIKVTSATTPLGRKNVKKGTTVRANLAPAGGEIYITLPLNEGRHLKMYIGLEPVAEQDSRRRGDNLKTDRIMYRVEWPDEKGYVSFERIGRNCWAASNVTYDELLTAIRREARNYLPEEYNHPR